MIISLIPREFLGRRPISQSLRLEKVDRQTIVPNLSIATADRSQKTERKDSNSFQISEIADFKASMKKIGENEIWGLVPSFRVC
jgi:hypothetical protein